MKNELWEQPATANESRKAIRHLRSGIASPSAARLITVGTTAVENEFSQHEKAWRTGVSKPNIVFVLGDWGFGKSHLRMLLIDSFINRRIAFIHDHVDGKTGSLAHLHRTVPRWMESIQVGPYTGIRSVVQEAIANNTKVSSWCRKHRSQFAWHLHQAVAGNDWAWSHVAGHQYQSPDYTYNHGKSLDILVDSATLLSACSQSGLVLLLDEAENISRQHDIRGRRKTYDVLGRIGWEPHLLTILFVTSRFFGQVQDDILRGEVDGWHKWTPAARAFLSSLSSIPVLNPPRLSGPFAKSLVNKIASVYQSAFGLRTSAGFDDMVLEAWSRTATKSMRLLVRIAIDTLDRMAP